MIEERFMDVEMKMPDLATTGAPIKVVRWLVEVGEKVGRGQSLLEVETDKAVMDVESVVTGTLKEHSVQAGEEVLAGQVVALFESAIGPASSSPRSQAAVASTAAAPTRESEPHRPVPAPHTRTGSFFERNRQARANARSRHDEAQSTRLGAITLGAAQRVVARVTSESKQSIPHFYLQTSANAEPMIARRMASGERKLVWDAFFIQAAGKALRQYQRMCYRFDMDQLIPHEADAVGFAVDENDALFTLVVQEPACKTPEQISDEIIEAVAQLRSGDPRARMSRPANMTVSNLGASNVESFAAVINPPESAILAVGKVMPTVVVLDGCPAVQNRVNLTLSVDHRVANGKYAAGFLGAIVQHIESL
jgi:pyruvate dehydrogenase E2 component (dihydrolipoamide acetyltransferase)